MLKQDHGHFYCPICDVSAQSHHAFELHAYSKRHLGHHAFELQENVARAEEEEAAAVKIIARAEEEEAAAEEEALDPKPNPHIPTQPKNVARAEEEEAAAQEEALNPKPKPPPLPHPAAPYSQAKYGQGQGMTAHPYSSHAQTPSGVGEAGGGAPPKKKVWHFWCKVCQVNTNSGIQWFEHAHSKKHALAVAALKSGPRTGAVLTALAGVAAANKYAAFSLAQDGTPLPAHLQQKELDAREGLGHSPFPAPGPHSGAGPTGGASPNKMALTQAALSAALAAGQFEDSIDYSDYFSPGGAVENLDGSQEEGGLAEGGPLQDLLPSHLYQSDIQSSHLEVQSEQLPYSHLYGGEAAPPPTVPATTAYAPSTSPMPAVLAPPAAAANTAWTPHRDCQYFLKGKCNYGDTCRFKHDPAAKLRHDADSTAGANINTLTIRKNLDALMIPGAASAATKKAPGGNYTAASITPSTAYSAYTHAAPGGALPSKQAYPVSAALPVALPKPIPVVAPTPSAGPLRAAVAKPQIPRQHVVAPPAPRAPYRPPLAAYNPLAAARANMQAPAGNPAPAVVAKPGVLPFPRPVPVNPSNLPIPLPLPMPMPLPVPMPTANTQASQANNEGDCWKQCAGEGTTGNGVPAKGTAGNGVPAKGTAGNGVPAKGTAGNGVPAKGTAGNGVPAKGTAGNGVPAKGLLETVCRRRGLLETVCRRRDYWKPCAGEGTAGN
eukprot:gene18405-24880_t